VRRLIKTEPIERLRAEIDFSTEHYYNLYSGAMDAPGAEAIGRETWSNLASLLADLGKMRGELSRMRRGVEELRLPAIEAIGLDRVVESLRGLEVRLRPLGDVLSRQEDEGRFKRVLKELVVVVDTLERVFELAEQQPGSVSEGVMRGLRSVYDLLLQTLGRYGLKPLEIAGAFDPHTQMAMGTEPHPELADGAVSRVMQRGYLLDGQVLRAAQVVVVKNQ
jgi:molecular chaperone GrpE